MICESLAFLLAELLAERCRCRTHYQPQFKGVSEYGPGGTGIPSSSPSSVATVVATEPGSSANPPPAPEKERPPFKHVFQTIFLDRDGSRELWSMGEIKKEEIILEKWWKQQSHRWQHCMSFLSPFACRPADLIITDGATVPFMLAINGRNRTHFAGAWTILSASSFFLLTFTDVRLSDMHEIGIVSGFAAAYQLGAPYPFTEDKECKRLFALYLAASHGSRMVSLSPPISVKCC